MRLIAASVAVWMSATAALADADVDRLIDALGFPALLRSFAAEGVAGAANIDDGFLNGQGGAVWADTVTRLYDPDRLETELRTGLAETLDPEVARTALIFLDSAQGKRIVQIEVQARAAMLDDDLEAMAKAAGAEADALVIDFLAGRDLIERNTDAGLNAQIGFFAGLVETSGLTDMVPDIEGQRPAILEETETWLKGYYTLIQSALDAGDMQTYANFWNTDVGKAIDDAVFEVFGDSYASLSYGLGQAVGRLLPASEL